MAGLCLAIRSRAGAAAKLADSCLFPCVSDCWQFYPRQPRSLSELLKDGVEMFSSCSADN